MSTYTTTTPYMGLALPVPGQENGPQWAIDLNTALTTIDSHNHSSGSGVQIPASGLNINSDLSFGGYNATQFRSARFSAQGSPLSLGTDLDCIYVSGVDLYYNDGNGNQIRITNNGAIVGPPGTISGLVSPASVNYTPASSTFTFESAVNTPAFMNVGPLIMGLNSANSKTITLTPPSAGFSASFTLTLPNANPSIAGSVLTSDTSGNMSWVGILPVANGGTGKSTAVSAPTQTIYTTGSGTYTTPTGVSWLRVRMIGGGGGGGGDSGSNGSTAGGATTFGTTFLVANGGGAGGPTAGVMGGTASGGDINATGMTSHAIVGNAATASGGLYDNYGGAGASTIFGAGGIAGQNGGSNGGNASTNSGAGGGGGGGANTPGGVGATGGAGGGYCEKIITSANLVSSYSYSVGSGGNGGNSGSLGGAGGAGGAGLIIIEEHYAP